MAKEYISKFTNAEIDEALDKGRQLKALGDTGWLNVISPSLPTDLNRFLAYGNFKISYWTNGPAGVIAPYINIINTLYNGVIYQVCYINDERYIRTRNQLKMGDWVKFSSPGFMISPIEPNVFTYGFIWIDTSRPTAPTLKMYLDRWCTLAELDEDNLMKSDVYDTNNVEEDIFVYMNNLINSFPIENNENKAISHINNADIHFTSEEYTLYKESMTFDIDILNSVVELRNRVNNAADAFFISKPNAQGAVAGIDKVNEFSAHIRDKDIHPDSATKTKWKNTSPADHTHDDSSAKIDWDHVDDPDGTLQIYSRNRGGVVIPTTPIPEANISYAIKERARVAGQRSNIVNLDENPYHDGDSFYLLQDGKFVNLTDIDNIIDREEVIGNIEYGDLDISSNWRSVTYGNGKYVAVATNGTNRNAYSTDGINWTENNSLDNSGTWYGVTYGDGKYVAVAGGGTYVNAYSTDGINWTENNSLDINTSWGGVTYGNNLYVAVAYRNGTYRNAYSTNGINWTENSTLDTSSEWNSVTYGNGKYVAVAYIGTNRNAYSTDGINWTENNTLDNSSGWASVTYGNGKYVAVAQNGTNRNAYSTDGINWTNSNTLATSSTWTSVTYGNNRYVAVAGSSINRDAYSTDGINWIENSTLDNSSGWYGVTYGNGKYVAVAGNRSTYRSATFEILDAITPFADFDLTTHSQVTLPAITTVPTRFDYVSNQYILGSDTNVVRIDSKDNTILETVTIDNKAMGISARNNIITYNLDTNNNIVATEDVYGKTNIVYSDSVTYDTELPADLQFGRTRMVGNATILLPGQDETLGYMVAISNKNTDAIMSVYSERSNPFYDVVYVGGNIGYIFASKGYAILISDPFLFYSDSRVPVGTSEDIWQSIAYGNGKFVMVSKDKVAYSYNGSNWIVKTLFDANTTTHRSIAFGSGYFCIVNNRGQAMLSSNGINWSSSAPLFGLEEKDTYILSDVIYRDEKFMLLSSENTTASVRLDTISINDMYTRNSKYTTKIDDATMYLTDSEKNFLDIKGIGGYSKLVGAENTNRLLFADSVGNIYMKDSKFSGISIVKSTSGFTGDVSIAAVENNSTIMVGKGINSVQTISDTGVGSLTALPFTDSDDSNKWVTYDNTSNITIVLADINTTKPIIYRTTGNYTLMSNTITATKWYGVDNNNNGDFIAVAKNGYAYNTTNNNGTSWTFVSLPEVDRRMVSSMYNDAEDSSTMARRMCIVDVTKLANGNFKHDFRIGLTKTQFATALYLSHTYEGDEIVDICPCVDGVLGVTKDGTIIRVYWYTQRIDVISDYKADLVSSKNIFEKTEVSKICNINNYYYISGIGGNLLSILDLSEKRLESLIYAGLGTSSSWYGVTYGNGKYVAVAYNGTNRNAYSTDGINWTENSTLDISSGWYSVTYGNGKYVAVAYNGTTYRNAYSTDGITWTNNTTTLSSLYLTSVTYGNNRFIAVAASGTTSNRNGYSTDGITWTIGNKLYSTTAWYSVTYGNNRFIAVGVFGGAYSTDGINWTHVSTLNRDNTWNSVTYGNGKYVAVARGGDSANRNAYSTDGINWTENSTLDISSGWYSVTYGNGKYVAVAYNGTTYRNAYSTDGITWTNSNILDNSSSWRGVTYGNNLYVAVAGTGNINRVAYSTDGINWKYSTTLEYENTLYDNLLPIPEKHYDYKPVTLEIEDGVGIETLHSINLYGVTYGNNLYVAVATSGTTNRNAYSTDGINWTENNTLDISSAWYGIAYGNGKYVAVAWSGTNKNAYSTDGINWTENNTLYTSSYWRGVTYGNNLYVAVAYSGTNKNAYSTDGINWTNSNTLDTSSAWNSVIYGNNLYVAVAYNGTNRNAYSTDGINWTENNTLDTSSEWYGVTYGNNLYVAVGSTGTNRNAYSTDGINWTNSSELYTKNMTYIRLIYNDDKFIAAGYNASGISGAVVYSEDGINWNRIENSNELVYSGSLCAGPNGENIKFTPSNSYLPRVQKFKLVSEDNREFYPYDYIYENTSISSINFDDLYTNDEVTVEELGITNISTDKDIDKTMEEYTTIKPTIEESNTKLLSIVDIQEVINSNRALTISNPTLRPLKKPAIMNFDNIDQTTINNGNIRASIYAEDMYVLSVIENSSGTDKNYIYRSTDMVTWEKEELDTSPRDIYFLGESGQERFIAISDTKLYYSLNADGWFSINASGINSIAYTGGRYVRIRNNNILETSTDLASWSSTTINGEVTPGSSETEVNIEYGDLDTSSNWMSVTYGNGKYVAVAFTGTNKNAYSTDGINWTENNTLDTSSNWMSITYGNGKYVAVAGSTGTNRNAYSTDGINWTENNTLDISSAWYSVTYGNNLYVAVAGSGNTNRNAYSTDGINWTENNTLDISSQWYGVTYGNNLYVAVASSTGTYKNAYSTDGINWTNNNTLDISSYWFSVAYGNNLYVAVADSGTTNRNAYSTDGINWTNSSTLDIGSRWRSVTYGNNLYVSTANSGNTYRNAYSTDGINWTNNNTLDTSSEWRGVTYGNNRYVAVAYTSTTNKSATIEIIDPISIKNLNDIIGNNDIFVGMGDNSELVRAVSEVAINWTKIELPMEGDIVDIIFNDTDYITLSRTDNDIIINKLPADLSTFQELGRIPEANVKECKFSKGTSSITISVIRSNDTLVTYTSKDMEYWYNIDKDIPSNTLSGNLAISPITGNTSLITANSDTASVLSKLNILNI